MKKFLSLLCATLISLIFCLGLTACGTDNTDEQPKEQVKEQVIDLSTEECNLSDYLSAKVTVDCEPVKKSMVYGLYRYESTGVITVDISSYTNADIKFETVRINLDLRISNPWLWKWEYTSGGEEVMKTYLKKDISVSLSAGGSATIKENIKLFYVEEMGSINAGSRNIEAPDVYVFLIDGESGKIIIRN